MTFFLSSIFILEIKDYIADPSGGRAIHAGECVRVVWYANWQHIIAVCNRVLFKK